MGGGNSKDKQPVKMTAQGQAQMRQNAQPQQQQMLNYDQGPNSGPTNRPNSQQQDIGSPIKMQSRVTSKPIVNPHQLANNPSEDEFVDHATPGTLAKKTKQQMRSQGGAVRKPEMVQESPSIQSAQQSPQKPDPMMMRQMEEERRKRQMEDDKIKQLQIIKEQQKAKQAAAQAQALLSQKREPTIGSIRNDTNGEEIFAKHQSGQKPYGLGYSNNKFDHGIDESEASGDFRGMDMQIQGRGLMNRDESQNYLGSAAVQAPQRMGMNFKVIDYGGKGGNNKENQINYANNGTMQVASSGIHMGIMGENNNKDDQQNRNIDMAELNELLGM